MALLPLTEGNIEPSPLPNTRGARLRRAKPQPGNRGVFVFILHKSITC
jgi:hypothetical protein